MSELKSDLFDQLSQLCRQYKVEVPGQRQAWPESVKVLIRKLIASGTPAPEIARVSGISYFTINKWSRDARKSAAPPSSFVEARVVGASPRSLLAPPRRRGRPKRIATVTVAEPKIKIASTLAGVNDEIAACVAVTVTVTTPSGFKLEGLPVDVALALVKAGSGR